MKKLRMGVIGCILALSLGYAAISTSIDLNGLLSLGYDAEDFNVIVSRIRLDGEDISTNINADGNQFTFIAASSTKELEYRVRNESTQYDADVSLSCTPSTNMTINQVGHMEAGTIETRTIELSTTDTGVITCTLNINKLDRTSKSNTCCNNAKSIKFTPKNSEWNVTTVEEALNYLRTNS